MKALVQPLPPRISPKGNPHERQPGHSAEWYLIYFDAQVVESLFSPSHTHVTCFPKGSERGSNNWFTVITDLLIPTFTDNKLEREIITINEWIHDRVVKAERPHFQGFTRAEHLYLQVGKTKQRTWVIEQPTDPTSVRVCLCECLHYGHWTLITVTDKQRCLVSLLLLETRLCLFTAGFTLRKTRAQTSAYLNVWRGNLPFLLIAKSVPFWIGCIYYLIAIS